VRDLSNPRGLLRPSGGPPERRAPAAPLTPYVAWYWTVAWDLRGEPDYTVTTLPHVSSFLSIEDGVATVHGPPRRRFERTLRGRGRVIGVRFTAGGLRGLKPLDVAAFADVTELSQLDGRFGPFVPDAVDPAVTLADRAATVAEGDRSVLRVADLAARLDVGVRALQRVFAEYVGVSPGRLIRRCRLQEAALRAAQGPLDWAALAADLGYYDQAHLVRDFTAVIGAPPGRFTAASGR
jgi:AraC-like DNA-binding protein